MISGLVRTLLNLLGTLPFVPAGLRDRAAGEAAAQVLEPMSPHDGALHAEAGTTCAACAEPFRKQDAVRRTGKGLVHDVCPR